MGVIVYGERRHFKWEKCIKVLKKYQKNKMYFRAIINFNTDQNSLASKDIEYFQFKITYLFIVNPYLNQD